MATASCCTACRRSISEASRAWQPGRSGVVATKVVLKTLIGIELAPAGAGVVKESITGSLVIHLGVAGGTGVAAVGVAVAASPPLSRGTRPAPKSAPIMTSTNRGHASIRRWGWPVAATRSALLAFTSTTAPELPAPRQCCSSPSPEGGLQEFLGLQRYHPAP